jgi:hypothetical protein
MEVICLNVAVIGLGTSQNGEPDLSKRALDQQSRAEAPN